jgi:MarR family transcriptional regulator for hemolysin
MNSLHDRFSVALYHSARVWRMALDKRLKHLGIGQAGWATIAVLAKAGRLLSQIEIAQAVGVEGATMVVMIDRLVKAGFVLRQPSPTDRRVRLVMLTDAGHEVYRMVKEEADAFRQELLADVDESALLQTTLLLEKLRSAAEASK